MPARVAKVRALSPAGQVPVLDRGKRCRIPAHTVSTLLAVSTATAASCGVYVPPVVQMSGFQMPMPVPEDEDPWHSKLMQMLTDDDSEYALRPADPAVLQEMIDGLEQARAGARCENTAAQDESCMRSWGRFTRSRGTAKWRLLDKHNLTFAQRYRENALQADFVIYHYRHMKGRGREYPLPSSAVAALSGIRRAHADRGFPLADATGVALVLRDRMKRYIMEHGKIALLPKRKEPLTVEIITALLSIPDGTAIGRRRLCWDEYFWKAVGTFFALLTRTGQRKSEALTPDGLQWNMTRAARSQIVWVIDGHTVTEPSVAQLRSIKGGDIMLWIPGCSKADSFGLKWAGTPIACTYSEQSVLNAAHWMKQMELAFPVEDLQKRMRTPLFTKGAAAGAPLRYQDVESVWPHMLRATGKVPEQDIHLYSLHSFRIFLASALKAMNVCDDDIQRLLRWASKEAMMVYTRPSRNWQSDTIEAALLAAPKLDVRQAANLTPEVDDYGLGLSFDTMIKDI
jgi:hypothetical protein